MSLRDQLDEAIEPPPFSTESDEDSDEQSEDGKCGLGGQIKEIIQALNDIRSQLAEQNKYLDVLTEKYIARPAQITFAEDEWETETEEGEQVQWEDSVEPIEEQEQEAPDFQDEVSVASAREWTKEARLAEASSARHRYVLGFTVATVFYLPMGLITTFFSMHLFKSDVTMGASQTSFIPIFLILSLTTYVFAACALWLVRDGDKIKRILNSWSPTDINQTTQRSSNLSLPNLVRRRKAWEAAI